MIWFFRVMTAVGLLNAIPLMFLGGAGGMIPVWFGISIISCMLSFRKFYERIFNKKWVKILFAAGMIFFITIEGLIIVNAFLSKGTGKSDYIIVLGAQVRGDRPSAVLQYRLDAAYDYLTQHPQTKAVLSGGQGPDEIMTEARAMYEYLVDKGISEKRLILEEGSHTTRENLINSFKLTDTEKENAKISVVSNGFHVLRARMQAEELGKHVDGISAREYVYLIPNNYLREFFAVTKEIFIYAKNMIS